MYAQIGDIVLSGHYGFTSFSSDDGSSIVEHALIDGKPKLQATGEALTKLTFSVNMNKGFINPEAEISKFKNYISNVEPVPFTLGTGEFLGYYVLTTIKVNIEQTDNDGRIIQCTVDLAASEFVTDSVENKGRAVLSNNPPLAAAVTVNKSLVGQITADIRDCQNVAVEMNNNLAIAEKNPIKKETKFRDTLLKIQRVDKKLENVNIITSNVFRLINEAQLLKQKIATTRTLLKSLKSFCEARNLEGAKQSNRDFQANMRNVGSLTAPFTKTYIIRRTA